MPLDRDLFAEAKRIPCAQIAEAEGVKLRRSSGRLIGACPLCGGDAKSTRFNITLSSNLWICRSCGEGGSGIDLELHLRGGEPLDAARRLTGSDAYTPMPPRRAGETPAVHKPRTTAPAAAELWRGARPAVGTMVETWLEARGIEDNAGRALALQRLRFHPDAFAGGERIHGRWRWRVTAPAMLAPIIDTTVNAGRIVGVHATYLSADGRAKAELRAPNGDAIPARKMWGRHKGGVCALTPLRSDADKAPCAWCHPEDGCRCSACGRENNGYAAAPLFVGEGVETTLSALSYWAERGRSVRAAAVLSLDNLQGRWLKDDEGCATQWPPRADPEKPPWTLDRAGHVVVIVDRDMSAIMVKRRDEAGGAKRMRLGAEQRAQLCADLAVQHWRNAGAREVEIALPLRRGADLNDMAREAA